MSTVVRSHRTKHTNKQLIQIWKYIHTPFELSPNAYPFHTCEWQIFDGDKAGCKRCSHIHLCGTGECVTVQTDEALVCVITGLCVHEKNFVQDDFSDCIAYKGPSTTANNAFVDYSTVYDIVYDTLCSSCSYDARQMMIDRFRTKLHTQMHIPGMHSSTTPFNLIDHIQKSVATLKEKHIIPLQKPRAYMNALVNICAQYICVCMNISHHKLCINVKLSDIKHNVIGLLYMMRFGICVQEVVVLPMIKDLRYILPPENMLYKIFKCPCKIITEIENKYKMRIRVVSVNSLINMGFITTNEEDELIKSLNMFIQPNLDNTNLK